MIIKMRYENVYQEIEVDTEEMREWLNVEVVDEESIEELIQEEIDKRYNRPDYNNYHKHYRHWGMPKKTYRRDDEEADETDGLDQIPDGSFEEAIRLREEYEDVLMRLESALPDKPEWVSILKAIDLDGMSIREYAKQAGESENNITQKRKRALNRLKKVWR